MKSRFLAAAAAVAALGFTAYALVSSPDRALVYCPVGIDAAGCETIVSALSGANSPFPGGVDRGYDGTSGTIDLATADLSQYVVFVVPSLADGADSKPYELLRNGKVAHNLSALRGRLAVWSGTPDQGTASRTEKDRLIRNLAVWARGDTSAAERGGIVVLQDNSDDASARYQWLGGFAGFLARADAAASEGYDAVQALTETGTAILDDGGQQLAYPNMASFGLVSPAAASGAAVDARGGASGGRVVLLTVARRLASMKSDKDEYLPGDTVSFTGSGWKSGEAVTLSLHQEPTRRSDTTLTATADGSGAITHRGYPIEPHDLLTRYYVTARGQSSGLAAQATFADAMSISAKQHEGQRKNPDGTLDGYTSGNITTYTEGDYINFRFTLTGDAGSTGTLQVRFTGQQTNCLFFEKVFWLISVVPNSGTAPVVTTVGDPVASGDEWVQTLSITFTGAGEAVVNYRLKLSPDAADCTGSSQHSRLNAGVGVSQTGQQNVPVHASDVLKLAAITAIKRIDRNGDGSFESTATAGEYQFCLDGSTCQLTDASGQVVFWNVANGSHSVTETQVNFTQGTYEFVSGSGTNCTFSGSTATATVAAGRPPTDATCTFNNGARQADVSITKTGPSEVDADATFAYTLTVSNAGPRPATNVTVTDQLDPQLTFISATGDGFTCSVDGTKKVTCTRATLDAGQSVTITIMVRAPPEGGTVTNVARVGAVEPDQNQANNTSATVTTTVKSKADLKITKTGPATVDAAGTITYNISVENLGPSTAHDVTVTDQLPAGVTNVSVSSADFTCSYNSPSNTVSCSRTSLAKNATATITITATAPNEGATLVNTATVSGRAGEDTNPTNDQSSITTTVVAKIDLTITKSDAPDPVDAGSTLTYTLTVTNKGPSSATSVTVTDVLPAGVTFNSYVATGGFTCSASASTVTCTSPSLGKNQTATITLTVTAPTQGGTITNTADVSAAEQENNPGDNHASQTTTVTGVADVAVDKSGPTSPVNAGATFDYTIAVTNNGPSTATNVTVTDVLPLGVSFVSAAGTGWSCNYSSTTNTVTCTRASLAVAAAPTITLTVRAPNEGGTIAVNTAHVSANEEDRNQTNNQDTAAAITVTPSADLSIMKIDEPDPVFAKGTLTYTLTVTNAGPSTATNVTVTDNLPAGITFTSATPSQGTCAPPASGTVTCSLGTLAPAGSATVTIVVTAPAEGGTITNNASVSATETDQNPSNNTASATTTVKPVTDLAIDKSGPATAVAGTNITYTVTVTNNGPSSSTGGSISDVLPAGTTFVSSTGCTNVGQAVTCNVGPLSSGASQALTITVHIAPDFVGALVNTATVKANETDLTETNNTDAVTTTVTAEPDVTVTKTANPLTSPQGGTITYTVTVTNAGPSTALGVKMTDNLPSGVSFGSVTPTPGTTCTQSGGTINCDVGIPAMAGTLPPGGTATIIITVTATGCGAVTNTATVSASNEPPTKTGNNSSSATTTIDCPPGKVTGGGQILVTNNGQTGRANFGFVAQRKGTNLMPTGSLEYLDHLIRLNVHSVAILTLFVSGTHAEFSGTCAILGATICTFQVSVDDLGEPGKNDKFFIKIQYTDASGPHVYAQGGTIERGNIQIHKQQ